MADLPPMDFASYVATRKRLNDVGDTSTRSEDAFVPRSLHDYAYASDRQMRAAFEKAKPVELAVASSVRLFQTVWRTQLLGNAVKVSERQFPRIHSLTKDCADTLHIPMPRVYIVNSPIHNAATYGTNEESFIMVHSSLVDHFSDEELRSVIGHECGHIHNSHVVYLTAIHSLTNMAGLFVRWIVEPALIALRSWSRRAEITCDRAGMLCSKDADTSARALTKLALGSKKLYEEFNLEAFLDQYNESKGEIGKHMEIFASHPWLPKRVLALREFSKSALYRDAAKLGPGGTTMDEVDEAVKKLIRGEA